MKKYKQHILAVTTEAAKKVCGFKQGFIPIKTKELVFDLDDVWIGSRNILEQDSNFKHIIPYVVVKSNNKFLVYQRTPSGGEGRLHGNHSIGFGGHIDVEDTYGYEYIDVMSSIYQSASRELFEELKIDLDLEGHMECVGLLYDDSNSVGTVHLGVVLIVELNRDNISSPEDQIDLKGFKTLEEMSEIDNFENWSKLVLEYLNV